MDSLPEIEIRPADKADTSAILGCLRSAFAPYCDDYTPAAFADTVLSAETLHLRLQQMHVLVATAAGNVVGTISGSCNAEEGHLRGMAVLPEWHGLGVAAKLLVGIEALLQELWLQTNYVRHNFAARTRHEILRKERIPSIGKNRRLFRHAFA